MCVKRASTGLCGGCRAIGIPTATEAGNGGHSQRKPKAHRDSSTRTRWSPRFRKGHSEGSAYKPLCGEVVLCRRVGRMGPHK